jgi:hypothetical protein
MLGEIKNKFENTSIKIKVELYIFPILLLILVFSFLEFDVKKIENIDYEKVFSKKYNASFPLLIEEIESFSSKNNINLSYISNEKKNINLKGIASLKNIKNLVHKLDYINSYSEIKSFNIQRKEKKYFFDISLSFDKFFVKKKQKLEVVKKQKKLKLFAIVQNNVLINNKWLVRGDKIDSFTLFEIGKNHVRLKSKNKNLVLKVYKDE